MVRLSRFCTLAVSALAAVAEAAIVDRSPAALIDPSSNGLQSIVEWDNSSLFVRGERIVLFSGEFHPFRLPVTSLFSDVFEKIRALGYNGVSFYVDWALLEGEPGVFRADGIFDLQPFYDAASAAGIYLIARPGPYINAEVSGGGFPGWLQRVPGFLRTRNETYLDATQNYVDHVSASFARNQITEGGPIILLQVENEYAPADVVGDDYFTIVRDQFLNNSIVVPVINNDVSHSGRQRNLVDIYGHDGYPLGFDCANPTNWPNGALPTNWHTLHEQFAPDTPYEIVEFQGGSFDPWGGPGFEACAVLLNMEFERVFYKNDFSFGVKIFNLYMTFGGTNWGNLGHPGGYTSYDYAAVLRENRAVDREKYSQAKLLANFLQASPAYLTATPGNLSAGGFGTPSTLTVTPLNDASGTAFYVVRHSAYNSLDTTTYKLTVPSSAGTMTIPQLRGSLSLHGRDSKIHVVDYNVGGTNLLYSSAEIFTWKAFSSKTVLVAYGGPGETHEMAFSTTEQARVVEGTGVTIASRNGSQIINFDTSTTRRIVQVGNVLLYIEDRNSAYNYWTHSLSGNNETSDVIIKAGYLVRSAKLSNGTLALTADFNETTVVEVIGAPAFSTLTINGHAVRTTQSISTGSVSTTIEYIRAAVSLPNLRNVTWHAIDSLPELSPSYSDVAWTVANHTTTNNTHRRPVVTPTVLFSSDYGYHTGSLIYRGHFTANGAETTLRLFTQGGSGFGMSAWLDSTFIGSFLGADFASNANPTFNVPALAAGTQHVITVLIDVMGLDENFSPPEDRMKEPRGILDYALAGHNKSDVSWKLTGNLGGEQYVDKTRGPLNEGALFFERQGFHQPSPPINTSTFTAVSGGPLQGIADPGVMFYTTSFPLDMPADYDVPLSFVFNNGSETDPAGRALAYRAILYVNGYQFGKYVHNIGPQDSFPVPEGILNYHGENWVGVALWALEDGGARLTGLDLTADAVVMTGRREVVNSPMPRWERRPGAY